jgi:hypothetical protein
VDALPRLAEDLGVLASLIGEARAYGLAEEARPLMMRHRTADELALLSRLFGMWAVCVGNEEAQATLPNPSVG